MLENYKRYKLEAAGKYFFKFSPKKVNGIGQVVAKGALQKVKKFLRA